MEKLCLAYNKDGNAMQNAWKEVSQRSRVQFAEALYDNSFPVIFEGVVRALKEARVSRRILREAGQIAHKATAALVTNELAQFGCDMGLTSAATRGAYGMRFRLDFNREFLDAASFHVLFRFHREDFLKLAIALRFVDANDTESRMYLANGARAPGLSGLAVVLAKLSRPRTYQEVIWAFGWPKTYKADLSNMFKAGIQQICDNFSSIAFYHPLLHLRRRESAQAIGRLLRDNGLDWHAIFGHETDIYLFADGTFLRTTNATDAALQTASYSGYKRTAGVNTQGFVDPHGILIMGDVHLGSANDIICYRTCAWTYLKNHRRTHREIQPYDGFPVVIADSIYPNTDDALLTPFPRFPVVPAHRRANYALSSVRQAIENRFGMLKDLFKAIKFRDDTMKIQLTPIALMIMAAVVLSNCYICLYDKHFSNRFHCDATTLEQYLITNDEYKQHYPVFGEVLEEWRNSDERKDLI